MRTKYRADKTVERAEKKVVKASMILILFHLQKLLMPNVKRALWVMQLSLKVISLSFLNLLKSRPNFKVKKVLMRKATVSINCHKISNLLKVQELKLDLLHLHQLDKCRWGSPRSIIPFFKKGTGMRMLPESKSILKGKIKMNLSNWLPWNSIIMLKGKEIKEELLKTRSQASLLILQILFHLLWVISNLCNHLSFINSKLLFLWHQTLSIQILQMPGFMMISM